MNALLHTNLDLFLDQSRAKGMVPYPVREIICKNPAAQQFGTVWVLQLWEVDVMPSVQHPTTCMEFSLGGHHPLSGYPVQSPCFSVHLSFANNTRRTSIFQLPGGRCVHPFTTRWVADKRETQPLICRTWAACSREISALQAASGFDRLHPDFFLCVCNGPYSYQHS